MSAVRGRYWHKTDDGRFRCDLCPRGCTLNPGQRALCAVRGAGEDGIYLLSYGQSSGHCIDPIEKKPLNHFYPGTPVLSFGQVGCNLTCSFCQNWSISKDRGKTLDDELARVMAIEKRSNNPPPEANRLVDAANPELLVRAARQTGSKSIAFTYNDPIIFLEYAVDIAAACREAGIHTVAVTSGYMMPAARAEFYDHMDAANIDLKAFTDRFYHKLASAHLQPVLETIEYAHKETDCWIELTNLIIPGENDSDHEIAEMSAWIMDRLGPNVPLHLSAFHPDYKMRDKSRTPAETLSRARRIALDHGLHYVYVGNVHDEAGSSTYCPGCGEKVIGRDWYVLSRWHLDYFGHCLSCGHQIDGRFARPRRHLGREAATGPAKGCDLGRYLNA